MLPRKAFTGLATSGKGHGCCRGSGPRIPRLSAGGSNGDIRVAGARRHCGPNCLDLVGGRG